MQEIPDLPGESQKGFKLLKRIRRAGGRNFFCLVLVFYEHLSSKIKAIKRYTVLSLPRTPYFYVSRDPPKLTFTCGFMRIIVKLPQIIPLLAYVLTHEFFLLRKPTKSGRGETSQLFVSLGVLANISHGGEGQVGKTIS